MLWKWLMEIRCSECGAPRWLNILGKWTPDGLFMHSFGGYEAPPQIIIDMEEQRTVFQSLEEHLGFNIDRIIIEAQRKTVKAWVGDVLEKCPRFLTTNTFLKCRIGYFLMILGYIAGFGEIKIIDLEPDAHILYHSRGIYYLPMAIGDGQGYFEAVFGGTSVADWMELPGEEYVIGCSRESRTSGLEDRLKYVPRKSIPGSVKHKRCPRCGVPLEALGYEWDWDRGIIMNKVTGLREIVALNSGGDNVCRELTNELGDEIPRLFIEIERRFMFDRVKEYGLRLSHSGYSELREDNAENLKILLDGLPFRGMGNPVEFSFKAGVLKLRVENPFNEARLCGKVLGFYEALEGRRGNLEWKMPEGEWAVEMEISPA